ncbi:MAG: trypsin-like serine protease [Alphaproteobacteria bacterium]|nr:trypsin-like serine protease [Alphaproteobacteria bacterium]
MIVLVSSAFANPAPMSAPAEIQMQVKDTGEWLTLRPPADVRAMVVGGDRVPQGEWDDAVGIVFNSSEVQCTGTLVAPNVVLTAGHCAGAITHVLVGSKDWFSTQGELIEVRETHVHPSYDGYNGYDIAVLKLRGQSSYTPRVIANDCVLDEELYDGAPVSIVGFGMTQQDGNGFTSRLMMAESLVRDADCSQNQLDGIYTGCIPDLRPGGEIAAGGRVDVDGDGTIDQADACYGDSGGPLYLHTSRGDFVVGVTSRSFIGVNPNQPCRDGGIWVRPDAVIRFIENQTGVTMARPQCNEPPEVLVGSIVASPGGTGATDIEVEDPDGSSFTVEVVGDSSLGEAFWDGSRLVFTAYPGVEGTDTILVAVTDDGSAVYEGSPPITIEVPVEVIVRRGVCGCASTLPGTAGLGLLAGLLGLVGRRRR